MLLASAILYALPVAYRATQWDGASVLDVCLSLLPLALVFPTLWLPRYVAHEEVEHVWRHAAYAFAFTVASGVGLHWDYVADHGGEPWVAPLVAYCALGTVTLWWFVAAHVLENTAVPALRTHQGDVAVLPLTLVAIATFVRDVPDEAFRFLRIVLFFVPVVVAWATLHFIAYASFATNRVTTHAHAHFRDHAYSGLVIATTHLLLIETRAAPLYFQFFPLVASTLTQVTVPPHTALARPLRAVAVALACGAGAGALFARRFGAQVYGVFVPAAAAGTLCVSRMTARWPVHAAMHATLVTCPMLAPRANAGDAVAVFAAYVLIYHAAAATQHCELLLRR